MGAFTVENYWTCDGTSDDWTRTTTEPTDLAERRMRQRRTMRKHIDEQDKTIDALRRYQKLLEGKIDNLRLMLAVKKRLE